MEDYVWELAAVVRVNPVRERLTLRRLEKMAVAVDKWQWNHTCAMIAALVAPWSERKINPADIHPYRKAGRPEPDIRLNKKESLAYLKNISYGKRNG